MARTSVNCPNCRQPITIELTRLFDLNIDPEAKQKLLSGSANFYQCPNCKAQGVYPTPIVYHDPDKELLLTYFPPELNVPLPVQEQTFGPLIKKTVDDLPLEKRKGYIFKPQSMLTQQRLFERILEADGITPEMMKAQQEKLMLIQTLIQAKPDVLPVLVGKNDAKIDEEFFTLLSRLAQASAAQGDEQGVRALTNMQKALLEHSTLGKQVTAESNLTREAMQELQELSKAGLTRENLLDLLIKSADSDTKLTAQATMARGGMDYQFFQGLSECIDTANVEERAKLIALREKLLKITEEVDATLKAQAIEAQMLLDELLKADKLEQATQQALPRFNQAFGDALNQTAKKAQEANDEATLKKLSVIVTIVQSASASSVYIELIEMLLQAPDEKTRAEMLENAGEAVNDDFMQVLGGLVSQMEEAGNQPELVTKLKELNREVLRFTMRRNLKAEKIA
jgi:hypothetical protein